jgi:hypothetical protein
VQNLDDQIYEMEARIENELDHLIQHSSNAYEVPKAFNIKDILKLSTDKGAVLTVCREKINLPLSDITIIDSPGNTKRIGVQKTKDPFTFKYLPEVLDIYPPEGLYNPGIAMFCFPEGIYIKKHSDMPKCFSFVLTGAKGERTYATCLIFSEEIQRGLLNSVYFFNQVNSYYLS